MKRFSLLIYCFLIFIGTACRHANSGNVEKQTDTQTVQMLELKADSCIRNYQYGAAAEIFQTIVNQYSNKLDSTGLDDYQNSIRLYGSIASVEPQRIHKQCDVMIPSYQNEFAHLIVPVKCGGKTDGFVFDTGANKSELSKKYFDAHKDEIVANATLQHAHRGGAGGMVDVDEYVLGNFTYTVGSQSNVLEQISVSLEEKHSQYDGVMGQDIFGQFSTMILNFKDMYLDLE